MSQEQKNIMGKIVHFVMQHDPNVDREKICTDIVVVNGADASCCGLIFLGDQAGVTEGENPQPTYKEIGRVYGVVEFVSFEINDAP